MYSMASPRFCVFVVCVCISASLPLYLTLTHSLSPGTHGEEDKANDCLHRLSQEERGADEGQKKVTFPLNYNQGHGSGFFNVLVQ